MGLLDEAIRQHLELKRQHGASDEELHLQEQEALGPVRREPVEPAAAGPSDAEPSPDPASEQEVEQASDEPLMEPVADAPVGEQAPAEPAGEASLEPPLEELHEPIDRYGEPVPDEVDAATEGQGSEQGFDAELSDAATSGWDAGQEPLQEDAVPEEALPADEVEDALPADEVEDALPKDRPEDARPEDALPEDALPEDGAEDALPVDEAEDDLLEETPEFLQETPEHDKLWFEQKPPRDFDFDE